MPIQVPLRLDLGQVLDGNQVSFHVSIQCQAGPLTFSRREHHYLRSGLVWNSLSWRPPVLDPLDDGRGSPATPVTRQDGRGPFWWILRY
ncbi:uncharacterized protein PG986_015015 [Apiospora aurea]|uniref:Uncharacterized protein n=1 Tax=Apiospora aurea TaxID=335848 RepID=A0ABR1PRN7_9PEZI